MITQEQIPMLAIPSMNDTHLEESLIIKKISTAVDTSDLEAIFILLNELLVHTRLHYLSEEESMKETEYPDLEAHKKEHDRHLNEIQSVIAYFEKHQEPRAVYAYIEGNLTAWTHHHADTMDRTLALFLKEND
ncbi:MAG: hemerythrin family protein [Campylobacterota bacterium]|nr:hemerythrin family protein [Campylobacterota bacterium]